MSGTSGIPTAFLPPTQATTGTVSQTQSYPTGPPTTFPTTFPTYEPEGLTYRDCVALVQVIVYVPALIGSGLLCWRHGFSRSSGWILLVMFAATRLAGGITQLATISIDSPDIIVASFICLNVGLAPLTLLCWGVLGRINAQVRHKIPNWLYGGVVLLSSVGMSLGIIGAKQVVSAINPYKWNPLSKAAICIATSVFGCVVLGFCTLLSQVQYVRPSEVRILVAVSVCIPLISVRMVYSLISDFCNSAYFNSYDGNVTVYLLMAVLTEIFVVIILLGTGYTLPRGRVSSKSRGGDHEMGFIKDPNNRESPDNSGASTGSVWGEENDGNIRDANFTRSAHQHPPPVPWNQEKSRRRTTQGSDYGSEDSRGSRDNERYLPTDRPGRVSGPITWALAKGQDTHRRRSTQREPYRSSMDSYRSETMRSVSHDRYSHISRAQGQDRFSTFSPVPESQGSGSSNHRASSVSPPNDVQYSKPGDYRTSAISPMTERRSMAFPKYRSSADLPRPPRTYRPSADLPRREVQGIGSRNPYQGEMGGNSRGPRHNRATSEPPSKRVSQVNVSEIGHEPQHMPREMSVAPPRGRPSVARPSIAEEYANTNRQMKATGPVTWLLQKANEAHKAKQALP